MTASVDDLATEVLELPAEDRAKILELLLVSFEPQPDVQQSWTRLALRRRDEVQSGKVVMVSGVEAVLRVRTALG